MRKHYLAKLFIILFAAVAIQGCSPKDLGSISVLQTPYALYFCDSNGVVGHTNDGLNFGVADFAADGVPSKALLVSGNNLMMLKSRAYVSVGNSNQFNPTYENPNPIAFGPSCVLNSNSGRVYMASSVSGSGIVYSDQHCAVNSWQEDFNFPSTDTVNPGGGVIGNQMTSFAQLQNSTIFGYDWVHKSLYTTGGGNSPWTRVNYAAGSSDTLPTSTAGPFHIFHINNDLVALDYLGLQGGWHSGNNGQTWYKYTGLPARPLNCGAAPFEQVFLVGTDSAGVYMLQAGGNFVPSNNGIDPGSSVGGIVSKQNLYEGGSTQQYIYIATSSGLYRSFDLGFNWTKIKKGNFYAVQ